MNPNPRWRAALNLRELDDAERETTLSGIQKVAQQSPLFAIPSIAAAYAALGTIGAALSANVATAAANEKQWKVSAATRDTSRAAYDRALLTLKVAVENNATSAEDVVSMGFVSLNVLKNSRTVPDAPASVLVYVGKAHGRARVVVAGAGYLGHFVAEVSGDPIGVWTSLPGTGKERQLSGYASGTKLWVRFAQIRWGMQGAWSTPVLVTIP